MVGYNQLYHGSTHIGYISKNGQIVKKVYKGSELVYQLGFDPVTFNVSSSLQTFIVPLGVSKIHVDCVGSKGFTPHSSAQGGNGGRVQCDLPVNGGDVLYITVGAIPSDNSVTYNASDIRMGGTELSNRIIVAGGGGSGCYVTNPFTRYAAGGAGGGLTGGIGEPQSVGGQGGTQSAGGLGAYGADAYDPYRSASGTLGFGGATGAGLQSALNGVELGQGVQNALQGAVQGAQQGAVTGGIMAGANAYETLLFKNFFDGIPDSYIEAAKIDGCTNIGIFLKIIIPISAPIVIVVSISVEL